MIANSPAAVAAAFSTSSRPVWPGDSRCAAIPDPITTAARNALPKNSAVSRRHSRTGALVTPPILTEEDSSVKIESMSAERNSYLARRAAVHAALADPARLAITDMLIAGDASPSELAAMLAMPSNLLAHHLHVLEQAGIITRRRSDGDRRRTYLRLVPGALDPLVAPPARAARRVLFVCTANSARSHLAAALWRRASSVPAVSAGTHPGPAIDPGAIAAARRHRLPLPRLRPRHISGVQDEGDLVVTVCDMAREELGRQAARLPIAIAYAGGCGLVRALGFYHVTQAVAVRAAPAAPARAIIWLTLFGAFSSPIYLPLTAWLTEWAGWRGAIRIEAGIAAVAFLLAAVLVKNPGVSSPARHPAAQPEGSGPPGEARGSGRGCSPP